jgi:hypothetical protein
MRTRWILSVIFALLSTAAGAADGDKSLTNLRGSVQYVTNDKQPPHPLAPSATIALADDDVAQTLAQSMGKITLGDASSIILASNTIVKMDAFDRANASAHAVVFIGKMRFRVIHPNGAQANYTFTTPTATASVRGTEGDIAVDPLDGVRINVYHIDDPSLPVHVALIDGTSYDVSGGQKIWMRWEHGKLVARVTPLTNAELNRFAELGPPATIDGGPPKS